MRATEFAVSAEMRVTTLFRAAQVDTPHTFHVAWAPAPGAGSVTVEQASLTLDAVDPGQLPTQALDVQKTDVGGSVWDLRFTPGVRVRSLALDGLVLNGPTGDGSDDVSLADQGQLDANHRLTISAPGGPPIFALPAVGGNSVVPGSLGGASLHDNVISLPDVAQPRLRIAVVSGDAGSFAAVGDVRLTGASATGVRYPDGVQVTADDGAVVWSSPKELLPGAPTAYVDLKMAVQKALTQRLKAGQPLEADFALTTTQPSRVAAGDLNVTGALLRVFPGVTRTTVLGDPAPVVLALPAGAPAVALDGSTRVVADLTAHYDGVRLLPAVSDVLPAPAAVQGRILGADWQTASMRSQGMVGQSVARIGLIGRVPEPCEVSVRLVRPLSGEPIDVAPVVLQLDRTSTIGTVWFVFPRGAPLREPVSVSARATRGRFFWATSPADRPLVRVAILDPEPAGALRVVSLGGKALPLGAVQHQTAVDLTAHFGSSAPVFESDLFFTIDLSDLTFRYQR